MGTGSVKSCYFENNTSGFEDETGVIPFAYGGAVCGYSKGITVEDSDFISSVGGIGGALYLSGGEVRNCNFFNNNAIFRGGGAIYSYMETIIDGCRFINNTAAIDGGAVDLDRFNSTVENSFFFNNSAAENGGALSLENDSFVKSCIFYGNNASSGGAISNEGYMYLYYSIFDDNHAEDGTNNVNLMGDAVARAHYVTPDDLGPMRTLNSSSPYIIVASDKAFVINYGGKYSLMVKDKHNVLAAGETVELFLNGNKIGSAKTDENGMAEFAITPKILKDAKAGVRDLVIKFTDANGVSVSKLSSSYSSSYSEGSISPSPSPLENCSCIFLNFLSALSNSLDLFCNSI